jgi:hypothetical protein
MKTSTASKQERQANSLKFGFQAQQMLIRAVSDSAELTKSDKLVIINLIDRVDQRTGECWPGQDLIAVEG